MSKGMTYVSRADKHAIIILVILLLAATGVGTYLNSIRTESELETIASQDQWNGSDGGWGSRYRRDATRWRRDTTRYPYPRREKVELILQPFDPNEVDSITMRHLGLPAFMAHNVLRYRQAGGIFRTPESFGRIYGMDSARFATLEPYITISEAYQRPTVDSAEWRAERALRQALRDSIKALKYEEGTIVDLNSADTTILKHIPGIGSGWANRIVNYRNQLGGFYSVDQLTELEEIYETVEPHITEQWLHWFTIETPPTPGLMINRWGVERLRRHPYLNFYQARVIVEYRHKHGKIKDFTDLSLYEEFTEADFARLAPYVCFD